LHASAWVLAPAERSAPTHATAPLAAAVIRAVIPPVSSVSVLAPAANNASRYAA
jgi:hypothetical protein